MPDPLVVTWLTLLVVFAIVLNSVWLSLILKAAIGIIYCFMPYVWVNLLSKNGGQISLDDHSKMLITTISYSYHNIKTGNVPPWANFNPQPLR